METRADFVPDPEAEWLEPDGLGGFASGTVGGVRTRRYHALLLAALRPPAERMVLVNGFEAWVETPGGRFPINAQRYAPDVTVPEGGRRLEAFRWDPWPQWTFRLDDGSVVRQELFVPKGTPAVVISWRALEAPAGTRLLVRPLLSGRDYHALHHENGEFRFDAQVENDRVVWRPYPSVPGVVALSNGEYRHDPHWYRSFTYDEERRRGLDHEEDLAAPGVFGFELGEKDAVLVLAAHPSGTPVPFEGRGVRVASELRLQEGRRRSAFMSALHRAADAYVVKRGTGRTIVAGYPWFTDWGRDTFIALRGLCIAAGRLDDARDILLEWAGAVSEGMLPNRFADEGDAPEFNSVDASLWYVVAVHEYLEAAPLAGRRVPPDERRRLQGTVEAIVDGYARGTRHGIRLDSDGLVAAGEPGVQLTWMDARVGDFVVTPRIGKPVEIQALWLNALTIASAWSERWKAVLEKGLRSFADRFWNPARDVLYDVVDADHRSGAVDATFRPNQILAVGGLPFGLLDDAKARQVVDAVERKLLTQLGLRTLDPDDPAYRPRYDGGVRERDSAYHQGTVWPWLLGPFVEAWVRVRGDTPEVRREARTRFLEPLLWHRDEAGLGHLSEIADGDRPHAPRGCPFQAWSVGEALRLDRVVLAEKAGGADPPAARSRRGRGGRRRGRVPKD